MSRYGSILRRPGALRPFLFAFLARLPISMAPLGVVLLVQSARGSYALAGAIAAAFTIGAAVATPGWGALMDRVGQCPVLAPLSVASGTLLAALALGAAGPVPAALLMVLAVGVGLTFPPISPGMRATWRLLVLPDQNDLRAAYALEAVVIETMFVGGPLLLSALLLVAPPVVPLLATAALLAVGGAGYATSAVPRALRPEPRVPVRPHCADSAVGAVGAGVDSAGGVDSPGGAGVGRRGRSPLRSLGAVIALLVGLLTAIGFGQGDVSLAATAEILLGDQALVGLLFMSVAGGSALGGMVYGARDWPGAESARLPVLLAAFAAGLGAVAVLVGLGTGALWLLMPLLFLAGLSVAPGLIIVANLVDAAAPRDRLSEAQAWLTTAYTAGAGAGTALGGVLVDRGGPARSLLGAAAAVLTASVVAAVMQRAWVSRAAATRSLRRARRARAVSGSVRA